MEAKSPSWLPSHASADSCRPSGSSIAPSPHARPLCRQVSWIRSRDLHILTSGTDTYANDARFQVARDAARNDWTLMIKFVQASDAGQYECQISTQSPISYPVQLSVIGQSGSVWL